MYTRTRVSMPKVHSIHLLLLSRIHHTQTQTETQIETQSTVSQSEKHWQKTQTKHARHLCATISHIIIEILPRLQECIPIHNTVRELYRIRFRNVRSACRNNARNNRRKSLDSLVDFEYVYICLFRDVCRTSDGSTYGLALPFFGSAVFEYVWMLWCNSLYCPFLTPSHSQSLAISVYLWIMFKHDGLIQHIFRCNC